MDTNGYYALLGPLVVVCLLFEAWVMGRRGQRVHRLPDTLSNLSTGTGQVLVGIFTGGFILWSYDAFRGAFGLIRWAEGSSWPWVLAFVGVDFCYYWFHRASHSVALLWALHEVHHQSGEMNLSVSARQTYFSDFSAFLFYWPLPLLGVPAEAFFFAVGCLSLYQAFLHTRLLEEPGPLGRLFNTPSYHRVHHGSDDGYRDRNFGSTLIVWDRLFGTFTPETHPPTFGIAPAFESHNPLWAQLSPALALIVRLRQAPGPIAALSILLRPPSWLAPWEPPAPPSPRGRPERPSITRGEAAYAVAQAAGLAVLAQIVLRAGDGLGWLEAACLVVLLLAGTTSIIGRLERRRWAPWLEAARLLALAAAGAYAGLAHGATWAPPAACGWALLSAGALWAMREPPLPAGGPSP